jgi:hypothetical protein
VNVVLVVLFVGLVNAGCMLSFTRAEKALRELGATWVRVLTGTPRDSSAAA